MTKLEWLIHRTKPVQFSFKIMKKIVLPGFGKLTLYEVLNFFINELKKNSLTDRAAAVTFNFLMAIPPTLLFLFTLLPYLPVNGMQTTIVNTVSMIIPNKSISGSINQVIIDFLTNQHTDLLSFGIILTLYYSSNGLLGLMRSFDKSSSVYKKRSQFMRRWTAIKLTVLLLLVVILSLVVLVLQTSILNSILLEFDLNLVLLKVSSLLLVFLITFYAISLIYRYAPSVVQTFPHFSIGAFFATIMISIVTTVFFLLVNNFINYNKVYGSIGTLIAFMVWIWMNTILLLIGYELNVSILLGRLSKNKKNV